MDRHVLCPSLAPRVGTITSGQLGSSRFFNTLIDFPVLHHTVPFLIGVALLRQS